MKICTYFRIFPLLISCMFAAIALRAQSDCFMPTAQIDLDINNVRARLLNGGDLWWDPVSQQSHYEVVSPIGVNGPSIYAGSIWLGGVDELGQLKVAAQTYRQTGFDFWPGPLDENGEILQSECSNFDRFWKVDGADIDLHRSNFAANSGNPLDTAGIPEAVLEWPGKNNPYASTNEFVLPADMDLAPFWDFDGDGNYNPSLGDYPVLDQAVPGIYPDQMVWWVMNDWGNAHTESGGDNFQFEIQVLAYAFVTDDVMNEATFYQYKLINKSPYAVDSIFFGLWVDVDIGILFDDLAGCVPERNMAIGYNDGNDDVFGLNSPILGFQFLKPVRDDLGSELPMSSFMTYYSDFSPNGHPEDQWDFYNYLNGIWKNDSLINCESPYYSPNCKFMYPDDPADPIGWSGCTDQTGEDKRMIMSMGAFRMVPGEEKTTTIGVYYVQPEGAYPCPSNEYILAAADLAEALHDSLADPSVYDLVWPGDANHDGIANVYDLLALGLAFNASGSPRTAASTEWVGQFCPDWAGAHDSLSTNLETLYGINHKHADSDGDGIVALEDQAAIAGNYNLVNPNFKTGQTTTDDYPLYWQVEDTIVAGEEYVFSINLGSDALPADEVYGIAFNASFQLASENPLEVNMPMLSFENSWMGATEQDILTLDSLFLQQNRWDIGITRHDHQNLSGIGEICRIICIMEMGSLKDESEFYIPLHLNLNDVVLTRADGTQVRLGNVQKTVVFVTQSTSLPDVGEGSPFFWAMPNPAQDVVELWFSNPPTSGKVELFDLGGRLALLHKFATSGTGSNSVFLDAGGLLNGMYIIRVTADGSTAHSRLLVAR